MTCYEDLVFRGLIKDMTNNEDFIEKLNKGGMIFYIGTDPTADSLHLGHLSSFLICERLARFGHHPIVLVGGATGLIGDPRPTKEREQSTVEFITKNVEGIKNQLAKYFPHCEMVNNYTWTKDVSYIDFLRDYGKFFNINYMINKDIIKRRLDEGISYTEFSYMLMQAYDFLWLYENKNCIMQVAGQDQWGNITSGVELIRKKTGKEAYAFTMPLVTTKSGVKFGKSEGNALWLDKEKTSPYDMYQYLINSEDEMVIDYLKRFTFLSHEEILDLERKHKEVPEKRDAHRALAFEVVKFLHGEEEANKAREASESVFSGGTSANMPTIELESFEGNILDLLVATDLAPSKSEARRLVTQGGVSIDNNRIDDPNYVIDAKEFIVQRGKKKIIKVVIK
ncbi:MAG: tyrosine--tRNA ligase [Bacilli bacterium]|nr:tyrosine--tRNA ligase [Bacilli bacterium]